MIALVLAAAVFAAVVLLLVMALGVALGGLVLLDRAVMWMAGL